MKVIDEAKLLMHAALNELAPQWEGIKRITDDGDVAVCFVEPDTSNDLARMYVEQFRGDADAGRPARLAHDVIQRMDLPGWRDQPPAPDTRRVILVAGRGVFPLEQRAGRFHFVAQPEPDAIVKALHPGYR